MIKEEATFEKFGYYSTDLSPKSNKQIVVACDECGNVRVVKKYAYYSLCVSCVRKGENSPTWKGGLVMRICEFCGTEFPVKPSHTKGVRGDSAPLNVLANGNQNIGKARTTPVGKAEKLNEFVNFVARNSLSSHQI